MKSSLLLLILILITLRSPLMAETLSLKEIILLSRVNNPTLLAGENDLLSAENDRVGPILIDNTTLSGKSDFTLTEPVTLQGGSSSLDRLSGSLSVNIPVIDQLSLSTTLDSDQNISAGITLKPLNMTTNQVDSRIKWENAQNSLNHIKNNLDWDILERVLTLTLREQEIELYSALEILENEQYQATHALYLAGEATYDDYLKALDDLTSAEENSLNGREALQTASWNLWTYSGLSESYDLESISLESVETLADELNNTVKSLQEELAVSLSVLTARNALIQTEKSLDTTLRFHPDLSVSANVNGTLDSSSTIQSTLSVNLTLSNNSFNGTKKIILEANRKEKELALSQSLFESRLKNESLLATIELAEKALELAKRDEERSRILANETEILFARGERTTLEKEEVFLALTQSQIGVFERASALIKAEADYLTLFPDLDLDIMDLLTSP
jgi:hypothetical protein